MSHLGQTPVADARAGSIALDCTLSGTGAQAKTGDLAVYAGGDEKVIEQLRPMFAAFTRQLHYVGEYGNGTKTKYVANLLVAIHNVSTAEAMVLGIKAGLDPHRLVELISSGAGNSRMFEMRPPDGGQQLPACPIVDCHVAEGPVGHQ
jgi:putative dehydrogenase